MKDGGPSIAFDGVPAAGRFCEISQSMASLALCPSTNGSYERPSQQCKHSRRNRPAPNDAALPKPHTAENDERQPRQCHDQEQQHLRPIAAKRSAVFHGRSNLALGRGALRGVDRQQVHPQTRDAPPRWARSGHGADRRAAHKPPRRDQQSWQNRPRH